MAHAHIVSDSDNHFIIDPISRQISNNSRKTILIKTDHNSEQFTFELPRYVEGHDMSLSNKVEVHFLNINSKTRQTNPGIYNVVDFDVDAEDNTKVLGTWLVSREATKYPGSLNFVIRFSCLDDDNVEYYSWNTAIYTGITIADTIENTETIVEDYVDIFRQWLDTLEMAGSTGDIYAISDDGTIINLCEKVDGLDNHVTELEAQITEFGDRVSGVEQDVSTFKQNINTEVNGFKESVNTEVNAFKESVNNDIVEMNSTINSFDGRIKAVEDFSEFFKTEKLTVGQLNSTSIGTEGTFYIRFGILQSTVGITTVSHNIGINLMVTKQNAGAEYSQHFISYIDDNLGMSATRIELSPDGKLSVSMGIIELNSDKTRFVYSKLVDLSGKFYYRKLS